MTGTTIAATATFMMITMIATPTKRAIGKLDLMFALLMGLKLSQLTMRKRTHLSLVWRMQKAIMCFLVWGTSLQKTPGCGKPDMIWFSLNGSQTSPMAVHEKTAHWWMQTMGNGWMKIAIMEQLLFVRKLLHHYNSRILKNFLYILMSCQ